MLPNSTTNFQGGNATSNSGNSSGPGDATTPTFGGMGRRDYQSFLRALQLRDNVFLSRNAKPNGVNLGALFGGIAGVFGLGAMATVMVAAHRQAGSVRKVFKGDFWRNAKFKNFFTFKWGTFFKKADPKKVQTAEPRFKECTLSDDQRNDAIKLFSLADFSQWQKLPTDSKLLDGGKFSYTGDNGRINYDQDKLHHFTHEGTIYLYYNHPEFQHHLVVDPTDKTACRISEDDIKDAKLVAERDNKVSGDHLKKVQSATPNTWHTLEGDKRQWCYNSTTKGIFCHDADNNYYSVDPSTGEFSIASESEVKEGLKKAQEKLDADAQAIRDQEDAKLKLKQQDEAEKITGLSSKTIIEQAETIAEDSRTYQWLCFEADKPSGGAWCKNSDGTVTYSNQSKSNYYTVNPKTGTLERLSDAEKSQLDTKLANAADQRAQQEPEKPPVETKAERIQNDTKDKIIDVKTAKAHVAELTRQLAEAEKKRKNAETAEAQAAWAVSNKGGDNVQAEADTATKELQAAKDAENLKKLELEEAQEELKILEAEAAKSKVEAARAKVDAETIARAEKAKEAAAKLEKDTITEAKQEAKSKIDDAEEQANTKIAALKSKLSDLVEEQESLHKTRSEEAYTEITDSRAKAVTEAENTRRTTVDEAKQRYEQTKTNEIQKLEAAKEAAKNNADGELQAVQAEHTAALQKLDDTLKESKERTEKTIQTSKNANYQTAKDGILAQLKTEKEQREADQTAAIATANEKPPKLLEDAKTERVQAETKAEQELLTALNLTLLTHEWEVKAASTKLAAAQEKAEIEATTSLQEAESDFTAFLDDLTADKSLSMEQFREKADARRIGVERFQKTVADSKSRKLADAQKDYDDELKAAKTKRDRSEAAANNEKTIAIEKAKEAYQTALEAVEKQKAATKDEVEKIQSDAFNDINGIENKAFNEIREEQKKAEEKAEADLKEALEQHERDHKESREALESTQKEELKTRGTEIAAKQAATITAAEEDYAIALETADKELNTVKIEAGKTLLIDKNNAVTAEQNARRNLSLKLAELMEVRNREIEKLENTTAQKIQAVETARDQTVQTAREELALKVKAANDKKMGTVQKVTETLKNELIGLERLQSIEAGYFQELSTAFSEFEKETGKIASEEQEQLRTIRANRNSTVEDADEAKISARQEANEKLALARQELDKAHRLAVEIRDKAINTALAPHASVIEEFGKVKPQGIPEVAEGIPTPVETPEGSVMSDTDTDSLSRQTSASSFSRTSSGEDLSNASGWKPLTAVKIPETLQPGLDNNPLKQWRALDKNGFHLVYQDKKTGNLYYQPTIESNFYTVRKDGSLAKLLKHQADKLRDSMKLKENDLGSVESIETLKNTHFFKDGKPIDGIVITEIHKAHSGPFSRKSTITLKYYDPKKPDELQVISLNKSTREELNTEGILPKHYQKGDVIKNESGETWTNKQIQL